MQPHKARLLAKINREPVGITPDSSSYASDISRAFNWYNQEKDKKEARAYLRSYVEKEDAKHVDRVPDNMILTTYGWMSRMLLNGCIFKDEHVTRLNGYIDTLRTYTGSRTTRQDDSSLEAKKPSVRDYLEENVKEYIGELEGSLDAYLQDDTVLDLYKDMVGRKIPAQYCSYVEDWLKRKASEFVFVYENTDKLYKEGYSNISKKKLTGIIKLINAWLESSERYRNFKKANRKPVVRKAKPPGVQVAKLKYKKEEPSLGLKSISPVEIIGASQVWIYNTKYKKISVYRTDSKEGIQVKGTVLQNYDPAQCEQKALRKPGDVLKKVLEGGKLVLRKLLSEIPSRNHTVNGRMSDECIILRAIR